ncbi:hypothetical protein IAU59_006471 [Kwoniella sp. CBS 9459]
MLDKLILLFALALLGSLAMSAPLDVEKRCINQQCAPPMARAEASGGYVATLEERCVGRQCSPMIRDGLELVPSPTPEPEIETELEKKCVGRQCAPGKREKETEKRCVGQQCSPMARAEEGIEASANEKRCIGRQCSPMKKSEVEHDTASVATVSTYADTDRDSKVESEKRCVGAQCAPGKRTE